MAETLSRHAPGATTTRLRVDAMHVKGAFVRRRRYIDDVSKERRTTIQFEFPAPPPQASGRFPWATARVEKTFSRHTPGAKKDCSLMDSIYGEGAFVHKRRHIDDATKERRTTIEIQDPISGI